MVAVGKPFYSHLTDFLVLWGLLSVTIHPCSLSKPRKLWFPRVNFGGILLWFVGRFYGEGYIVFKSSQRWNSSKLMCIDTTHAGPEGFCQMEPSVLERKSPQVSQEGEGWG